MKLLADQNVEEPIVAKLRRAGHDVLQLAATLSSRALDDDVLRHAREDVVGTRISESMVVVTERAIRRRTLPALGP